MPTLQGLQAGEYQSICLALGLRAAHTDTPQTYHALSSSYLGTSSKSLRLPPGPPTVLL